MSPTPPKSLLGFFLPFKADLGGQGAALCTCTWLALWARPAPNGKFGTARGGWQQIAISPPPPHRKMMASQDQLCCAANATPNWSSRWMDSPPTLQSRFWEGVGAGRKRRGRGSLTMQVEVLAFIALDKTSMRSHPLFGHSFSGSKREKVDWTAKLLISFQEAEIPHCRMWGRNCFIMIHIGKDSEKATVLKHHLKLKLYGSEHVKVRV